MKKINVKVAAWLLIGCFATSSCIGSFTLFNKFAHWETVMTDNKYVNAIVGFILTPIVGGICMTADALVLNSIEFWTGTNPLANTGKTKQVMGKDGRYYAVTTTKNGYEVKSPDGDVTRFIHNEKTDSWSMEQNGEVKELFRFNGDGTIMANINGETENFTLNADGVYKARMMAGNDLFFAMN